MPEPEPGRMPPPPPAPDIGISTTIREGSLPATFVVAVVVAVFAFMPLAAWALHFAAHLPVGAWYASLFPH